MFEARLADRALGLAAWCAAGTAAVVCLWIVMNLIWIGGRHLTWEFVTIAPEMSGRSGGIGPILVSTAMIVVICAAVVVPVGLGAGILLAQQREKSGFARAVRLCLDILAGMPSIVFGLFGLAFFCRALGLGFSLLAGGLTLSCMVLPIVIRIVESSVSAVADGIRLPAAALGLSLSTTLLRVVLPAAVPGLLAGFILGLGRALSETAALLFTSGYATRMPESWLDSGRALSVHIYDLALNVPGGDAAAAASALVLVALLLVIDAGVVLLLCRWTHRV
jgi:phosphate transport system permease protein